MENRAAIEAVIFDMDGVLTDSEPLINAAAVAMFQELGWDAIVTGDDVEHKKPAPDIFLEAAARLKVPPTACVVVEDAVNGVEAAKAAGMFCVAVAQSFDMAQLGQADLVRRSVVEVSLADLGFGQKEDETAAAE